MWPRVFAAAAALALAACGYVGDPLPPLANVPTRPADLAAVQRGARIIAHFTVPVLTTESKPIPPPLTLDLRVGPHEGAHFDVNQWAAGARHIPAPKIEGPLATYEIPCTDFAGKEVILAARVTAGNGKQSEWSNFAILPVVAPPAAPSGAAAENVSAGVRLTWSGSGEQFRVLRKAESGDYQLLATLPGHEWTDTTTEYGKQYRYLVQALVRAGDKLQAESDLSAEIVITPRDVFPPAVPTGLHADAAPGSIELRWEPGTEPDLAGYRVYRAAPGGNFEVVAESTELPAWSDRTAARGKTWRYAVSALDRSGNESARSAPVEVAYPD